MVRHTPRALAIRSIELAITSQELDGSSESSDDSAELLHDTFHTLVNTRYLNRSRLFPDLRDNDYSAVCLQLLNRADSDFKRNFRMYKAEFDELLDLIKGDSVFVSTGRKPQAPPQFQLMVALYRLGHDGDGASVFQVHEKFGIGEGTACNWTERVILALLKIEPNVTKWPSREERAFIANQFEERWGIPGGCIGAVDGFHVVLQGKPRREDAYAFFNRKERYSFNIPGVADHANRLRYIACGFPGSAHDMRVYRLSSLATSPARFFESHEYLLADSAYSPSNSCVPLFKRMGGQSGYGDAESNFNHAAASARVVVEHAYGILKCRWSSLRGLRIIISTPRDEIRATAWIRACVVLHNLLIDSSGGYDEHGPLDSLPDLVRQDQGGGAGSDSVLSSRHHPRRVKVMNDMGLGTPSGPASL